MSQLTEVLESIPAKHFFSSTSPDLKLREVIVESGNKVGSSSRVYFARVASGDNKPLRLAVKTPQLDGQDSLGSLGAYIKQQLSAEAIQRKSGSFPQQYGVWANIVGGEGVSVVRATLDNWHEFLDQVSMVVFLETAIPEQATQLLEILSQLGLETIQDGRSFSALQEVTSVAVLENYYKKIIEWLITIHHSDQASVGSFEKYRQALENIIKDASRFDGIRNTQLGQQLPQEQLDAIRLKMMQLASNLASKFFHRLTPVHGDAWASNFFVDRESGEIYGIDPGNVGESDPALDVAFALMDLVMVGAASNAHGSNESFFAGEYVDLADRMLSCYKEKTADTEIEQILPLFVAFKLFVAATFDMAGKPAKQQALLDTILGMLTNSLSESGSVFSFAALEQYRESRVMEKVV